MRKWMNLVEMVEDVMVAARPAQNGNPEEELIAVRQELDGLKARHEALIASAREPGFEQRKDAFIKEVSNRWTSLADREWELMQQIGEAGGKKKLKEFFSSK